MNDAIYTRNKIPVFIYALYTHCIDTIYHYIHTIYIYTVHTHENFTSKFIAVISYANVTFPHTPHKNLEKMFYHSRKWISNNIAPNLTARYIQEVHKAAQYTHFSQPHILYERFGV